MHGWLHYRTGISGMPLSIFPRAINWQEEYTSQKSGVMKSGNISWFWMRHKPTRPFAGIFLLQEYKFRILPSI